MKENIKPSHYKAGSGDVIEFCQTHDLNFQRGNIVKYVTRSGKKDKSKELEDLLKAKEYLDREISHVAAKGSERSEPLSSPPRYPSPEVWSIGWER